MLDGACLLDIILVEYMLAKIPSLLLLYQISVFEKKKDRGGLSKSFALINTA